MGVCVCLCVFSGFSDDTLHSIAVRKYLKWRWTCKILIGHAPVENVCVFFCFFPFFALFVQIGAKRYNVIHSTNHKIVLYNDSLHIFCAVAWKTFDSSVVSWMTYGMAKSWKWERNLKILLFILDLHLQVTHRSNQWIPLCRQLFNAISFGLSLSINFHSNPFCSMLCQHDHIFKQTFRVLCAVSPVADNQIKVWKACKTIFHCTGTPGTQSERRLERRRHRTSDIENEK